MRNNNQVDGISIDDQKHNFGTDMSWQPVPSPAHKGQIDLQLDKVLRDQHDNRMKTLQNNQLKQHLESAKRESVHVPILKLND